TKPTDTGLDWTSCSPAQPRGENLPFECATLQTPLDYAKPDGDRMPIALIRTRATGKNARIGSLIFNFGGPGGSGVEILPGLASAYAKLGTRYDLVSFDPRGVGESAPVTCLDDRKTDAQAAADATPETPAEIAEMTRLRQEFIAACEKNSGRVLPYVGTANAARDVDRIRAALGEARTYYFGMSYGTFLGGAYAHRFPAKVGRAVLDAAVDPAASPEEGSLEQAGGFQLALGNFAAACVKQAGCEFGSTRAAVLAWVGNLLKRLDGTPLRTSDPDRMLTESLGVTGIIAPLYSEPMWPQLAQALTMTRSGDGSGLLALADSYLGRDDQGHYSNELPANTAINCADSKERYTPADVQRALPRFRAVSPVFGDSLAWGIMGCTDWPVTGDNAARDVSAASAGPIVVIGNTGDPATPYASAGILARQLGSGVMVTLKGEGHGAYNTGNVCIQKVVNDYLLDGVVPAKGVVCD
ncbi:MAG: alpha/beta hydrolase, partial [Streptosporangiaceae bacterium]